MPIYEYECTQCGSTFEVLQKFSDAPLDTCEKCAGKVRKLISHSSFHLKGSGWYVTDYAGKKTSSSGTETAKPEASCKVETKTESKASAGE